MKTIDVLFAVIAPREVEFFVNIANYLKEQHNINSAFLTFYQPGDKYIAKNGYPVFSLHKNVNVKKTKISEKKISELEKKYKISNIRHLLVHEKLTFKRYNEKKLIQKLIAYDKYFEYILKKHKIKNIVQELGGFIAPLSLYYNAINTKTTHFFIEPAMFKGRLFFNKNSIDVSLSKSSRSTPDFQTYIKNYINQYSVSKTVVIPAKDKAHYKGAGIGKLLQKRFIFRTIGKLYHKYIKNEKEEYDAISTQISNYIKMFFTKLKQNKFYKPPDYKAPYVYYPLHVPLDFQLTIRESLYLDQLALIENLLKKLPFGWKLYIKEHPASIGAYDFNKIKRLLKQNKNLVFIKSNINSYDLIKNAQFVVTVNSKVGAEAVKQKKHVYTLGHPYYLQSYYCDFIALQDLDKIFYSNKKKSQKKDLSFYQSVFFSSFEGELYLNTDENIKKFGTAIKTIVEG